MKTKQILSFLVTLLIIMATSRCSDDEGTCFKCNYETRKTTGCSGTTFGPWEQEEGPVVNTDDIKSGLDKQGYCDLVYPASDSECAGGCCVDFEFRNVTAVEVPC